MQYIERINNHPNAKYYKIHGDFSDNLKRYIVTTPETRNICNKPEIMGIDFTEMMTKAMTSSLINFPEQIRYMDVPEETICILNFLRGGLNFDLRNCLYKAYGFKNHSTSFITSQRFKDENERWGVTENQYRKFIMPKGANIFIGDIVATGVTIENGFEVLLNSLGPKSSIKSIVFFTIGTHKVEKILEKYDEILREKYEDYAGAVVVYFEGKFKLVDSKTNLKICIQGTDLIRYPSLLAPEFELSQYENVTHPLERCTIYDGGSRSFDTVEYVNEAISYWEELKQLALDGFTLYEALKERWPEYELQAER